MTLDATYATALALAYVAGSVPFGFLLVKFAGKGDVRKTGSGSVGATNVLRLGSRRAAVATLLLDVAKARFGLELAVLTAGENVAGPAAVACCLGHLYPIWLGFSGGKGVSVAVGLLSGLSPITAVVFVCAWVLIALAWRISSLASVGAVASSLPVPLALGRTDVFVTFLIIGILILRCHAPNVGRLLAGTEPLIGADPRRSNRDATAPKPPEAHPRNDPGPHRRNDDRDIAIPARTSSAPDVGGLPAATEPLVGADPRRSNRDATAPKPPEAHPRNDDREEREAH